jgi:hypothetical protein
MRKAVLVGLGMMVTGLAACGSTSSNTPTRSTGSTSLPPSSGPTTSAVPPSSIAPTTATTVPTTVRPLGADTPCQNGQITVRELGGQGAGGTFVLVLGFTDSSQLACTLTGYPGVAILDAQGAQVSQGQRQPTSQGISQAIKLSPGQTVSASIAANDGPTGTETSCMRYPAVLVTPPEFTVSQRIAVTGQGFPGCSTALVYPIQPGTNGGR